MKPSREIKLKKENDVLKKELEELKRMLKKLLPKQNKNDEEKNEKESNKGKSNQDTENNKTEKAGKPKEKVTNKQDVAEMDQDEIGYQLVQSKKPKKRLRESDTEDTDPKNKKASTSEEKKPAKNENRQIQGAKKGETPPPVTVNVRDWNKFSSDLNTEKIRYNKARNTPEGIKITPNEASDYRALIKLCDKDKVEYFTYSLKEDKKKYFVIKGLHISTDCKTVEKELKEIGAIDAEVTRLISRVTKQPTAVMQLKTNYEKIMDIDRLTRMVVKIEIKRKDKGPIQCFRCQKYGHARRNCGFEARCVRCGQHHESTDCKLEKGTSRNASCANCRGNHPANYKGCEYAFKKINKKTYEKPKNKGKEEIKKTNDATPTKSLGKEDRLKAMEIRMDKMMSILEKLIENRTNG